MNKAEIASYLVSLHTLLEAQTKGSISLPNATLAEEYDKHWGMLKEIIRNETRNGNDDTQRRENGAEVTSGGPLRSSGPGDSQREEREALRGSWDRGTKA